MKPPTIVSRVACLATVAIALMFTAATGRAADPCIVPDNGAGTVTLPPVGCQYLSPTQVHMITNGLPPGTTIILAPIHKDFICRQGGGIACSNNCFVTDDCNPQNGETEQFNSTVQFRLKGTGLLNGWTRDIGIPNVFCQVQTTARGTNTAPTQTFSNAMQVLQGQITGDPDFDLLQVRAGAGSGAGLPASRGATTLTRQGGPGSSWAVDSFFDITYRIDFVGAPGGHLAGFSGSTVGSNRMVLSPVQPKEHFFKTNTLPPLDGQYVSPAQFHVLYANGILLTNASHKKFTDSHPPPPPGTTNVHTFMSSVQFATPDPLLPGTLIQVIAPAQVTVRVGHGGTLGGTTTYNTEMLQLDVSGAPGLPPGMLIRESPTRASTGRTTTRQVQGGYMIASFFDVFTELSLNNGGSWSASTAPTRVELLVDPSTIPPIPAPTPILPPPNDKYVSPRDFHIAFANGVVISNASHKFFTDSQHPPTPGSPVQSHSFDSVVDAHVFLPGQPPRPMRMPALAGVSVQHRIRGPEGDLFDTEMVQLDIAGGDLPPNVRVRVSPTQPSLGATQIAPSPDGTYQIHSFFDIFTEISMDFGNPTPTWSPATGPVRVELVCDAPETPPLPTPVLPPANGSYVSPADYHAALAMGIVISNISHQDFLIQVPQPPPPPGVKQFHTFGSQVGLDLSMDGGATFQHVQAPANVVVCVSNRMTVDNTVYLDTEMMTLDIGGGGLPPMIRLRESPTRQSLGRASVRMDPADGQFRIGSFFDIFVEVSVDGGVVFQPSTTGPSTVSLTIPGAQPLTMTCPPDITVPQTTAAGAVVNYPPPTVAGGCPPYTINCNPMSGSSFSVGTTPVICTVSDGCAPPNSATCVFNVTVTAVPQIIFPTDQLPPPTGVYISPRQYHILLTNGIIVSNISHRRFTNSQPPQPLPPLGGSQIHTFGSTVEFQLSMNNGASWQSVAAQANVAVNVSHSSDDGDTRLFDTEMLSLNITGGGVMIRESPTRASTGRTFVTSQSDGQSRIGSFFDIFTEVSLDGGISWMQPVSPATHVELRKCPSTIPPIPAPTKLLPPPNDVYVSPALFHALYAQGIIIKDVRHLIFTQSMPAPVGGHQVHAFESQLDFQLSTDGGVSFTGMSQRGPVTVDITHRTTIAGTEYFDTEMLQLDLAGDPALGGISLRESPSKQSLGGVAITPQPDGTFRIHSFFDIFTELSMDGGGTWSPGQNPVQVNLECKAPEAPFPSPDLPPPTGQYVSPQQFHALYAMGIVIKDVKHKRFLVPQPAPPLPPPGGTQDHNFDSTVEFQLSTDGGQTFQPRSASAEVSVRVTSRQDDGSTRFFDTEMLQLSIQGGTLGGIMLRESPTKRSLGQTSVRMVPGGGQIWDYISSFFDIFTELSLDGGQTWHESQSGPVLVALEPAPQCSVSITCPPDMTVQATAAAGIVVNYPSPTAAGNCPPIAVVCNPMSGTLFSVGTTPVNCTATDSENNAATCSFNVTVLPPVVVGPPEIFFPTNRLPPITGLYITPAQFHAAYANGIIIRDPKHRFFTQNFPPPPPGTSQVHEFGSTVELEHSTDGGVSFHKAKAPAQVTVRVTGLPLTGGTTRTFDTEMLQLHMSGGSLPAGVMLRESPTRASTGRTTIRQVPGGSMIGSFFDVFTEVSIDGGQTWSPSAQPGHVELRSDPAAIPPITTSTPLLPPPNDIYISPTRFHQLYAMGIVITNVRHRFFTQSMPPPPPGGTQVHQFDSQVDMQVSINGGASFVPIRPMTAPVQVRVANLGSSGQDGVYDTEMLSLSLQGGDLATLGGPQGIMVRESPTLPSRGGVNMERQPDGSYRIGSFFDIFTEVSLDGGGTWLPATTGPARVELVCAAPEKPFATPNLPPVPGQYVSPERYHALFAQGIVISNVTHRRFTNPQPPPPPGGSSQHNFNSEVSLQISLNGGSNFTQVTVPNVPVSTRVSSLTESSGTRFFDTEMLSLTISSGLPGGVMVRESPSKASLGRTSMRVNPPGLINAGENMISSFFDIFVEVSTDGGATWLPSQSGPVTMALGLPCGPPPPLTIVRNGNTVSISWVGASYRLQCTDQLGASPAQTAWLDVLGVSTVTLQVDPNGNRFYRLICP